MKRSLSVATMAAILLLAGLSMAQDQTPPAVDLKKGDSAPAFSMMGSDGKTHTLAEHAGKQAVVIAWFPKAFTGGCTAECKSLKDSGEAIRKFNVAYYAASVDDAETNKKFAESLGLDFPILSDPDKSVSKAYGVLAYEGKAAARHTFYIGPDGKILLVDREVKPASSGTDVAAHLTELGIKQK